ncbi:ABC transporter ATP-binding protein [Thermaerobacter subterraneus]|uniref:Carbohydrate ABC transporter ATP-binding protein, CUT1 family n=1 Tax=Thermaerobacter subterraneus DSM 13965 TaxID=867903 RepID=K6PQH6_9FIRM|nr:ABC transporter ATP-binding protein [Thermaerobacter subterraneus]EKP95197.1 carbohydrate ABC transporter ATP-binding protein, CUT1 family [Thermaerobacter subterraneus DSM 13965]
MRIRLEGVTKRFGTVTAVDRLTLELEPGRLVALLGPSGCGKSTTLYMLAGVLRPTEGDIFFDGVRVNDVPPQRRNVGMVFQSYALYPHMTVFENIAFPLRMQRLPEPEIRRRVHEMAELVQVGSLLDRRPEQLSGGQQQRVALARALVKRPALLLLDEPLSNLDAQLRQAMRAEIRRIQRELGVTAVLVTHDQTEAMSIADWVVLMNGGRCVAQGTPYDLYQTPPNRFTASFIGHPPMNWVQGRVSGSRLQVDGLPVYLPLPATAREGEVAIGIRPQHVQLVAPGRGHLDGRVTMIELLGHEKLVTVEAGRVPGGVAPSGPAGPTAGTGLRLQALVPADAAVVEGEAVGVRLPVSRLHLFRLSDGNRLALPGAARRPLAGALATAAGDAVGDEPAGESAGTAG